MMNRLFLIALAVFSTAKLCLAQDSENGLKPEGGDWNLELNLSPLSSSPISINYIRLRKFTSATNASRMGVSISGEIQKPDKDLRLTTYTFNLRPGIERHFQGTNRLSPYLGGELDIAFKNSSVEDNSGASDVTLTGAWSEGGSQRGFLRMGLNMVMGADIYFIKDLYLGTEVGFGFSLTNYSNIESSTNSDPVSKGGSIFQIGPNYNGAIRLGYIF